jgi:hypothetical protein
VIEPVIALLARGSGALGRVVAMLAWPSHSWTFHYFEAAVLGGRSCKFCSKRWAAMLTGRFQMDRPDRGSQVRTRLRAGAKGIRTAGPTRMRYIRVRQ